MTREEFISYIDAYNLGDESLIERFFDPDIVFENYGGYHRGPDVLKFLGYLNSVVQGRMVPRIVLIEGDTIAMEADMEILALKALPDLPAGGLKEGDRVIARTFVIYETRGPIIKHIRIAGWPPKPA